MKNKLSLLLALIVVILIVFFVFFSGKDDEKAITSSDKINSKPEHIITFAHSTSENTSIQVLALKFKEYAESLSKGKILVNIYPNASLGSDREVIEGTQRNEITMVSTASAAQVNFVPSAVIFDLPFIFSKVDAARKVLNDKDLIKEISIKYNENGLKYLGATDLGFRTLTANKEIHTPDDLKGLAVRTLENKYHIALWKELGANPTPLPFNELYTSLQQGTVDAQENPVELIYSQKFYEQQKYIIGTNHVLQPTALIMNNNFYQSLPEDLKLVIDESAKKAIVDANKNQDDNYDRYLSEMKSKGTVLINLTPEELKPFKDRAMKIWSMIEKDVDPKVYKSYMDAVAKYQTQ